jgi:hypothetical protein
MVFEIGEVIERMREDLFSKELQTKIEQVRKDKGWDEFYLVFAQKPDLYLVNVLRNVWVASETKPNPISNTIHFYINWKQGRIEHRVFVPSKSNIYNYPLLKGKKEFDLRRKIGDPLESVFSPREGVLAK